MTRQEPLVPKGVAHVPLPVTAGTRHFAFVLVPGFTLLAFSAAVEPLRIANQLAQQPLYSWHVLTESGDPVASSAGIPVVVDGNLTAIDRETVLLVCAGNLPEQALSPAVVANVQRHHRFGGIVGGICTGAFTLARAGLLADRMFTLHWENQTGFAEAFPALTPSGKKYEIDARVMTCGGGAASIDMMVELIARDHGRDFSAAVSEMCIRRVHIGADDDQRSSLSILLRTRNPALVGIVELMQANLEDPLDLDRLVEQTGYSRRHIERLFKTVLGQSPGEFYRGLRLDKARTLLSTTNMPLIQIAASCGFVSVSHFTRRFREHYGVTPSNYLQRQW